MLQTTPNGKPFFLSTSLVFRTPKHHITLMSDQIEPEDLKYYDTPERISILYQSTIDYYGGAQKSAIPLNGGAVIVLLGFVGAVLGAEAPISVQTRDILLLGIGLGTISFASGMLSAGYASLMAYKSQISHFSNITGEHITHLDCSKHNFYFRSATNLILLSCILFMIGSVISSGSIYLAFKEPPSLPMIKHST